MGEKRTIIKGIGFCGAGIGSNICLVDVQDGKILRTRPFHFDEAYPKEHFNTWRIEARGHVLEPGYKSLITPLSISYKKRAYSKNRIPYPLKRIDWDPDGERNPQTRGISDYERISWDEAAALVAREIKRIHDEYHPYSILTQFDGHGETKILHPPHGCILQVLDLVGGSTCQARQPDSWEGWYWGAKHMWGMHPLGQQALMNNVVKDISENADALLFWGADPETTPWGWGGQMASKLCYWFGKIGVKHVHIAPDLNYTNAVHADKWIPVYPNTDAALQLAIAYVWITEGTYDQEYLDTHAVGFENFAYYVKGMEDGIPKTPKWAEKICGVPAHTIKAFARYWASHAVSIAHCNGGSFIRAAFAHEPARLEVALLGMQGLGKPGANQFKFLEWTLFGMRSVSPLPPSNVFPSLAPVYGRGRNYIMSKSFIPKTLIPEALMNPPISWYSHVCAGLPREDQFDGPFTFPHEGKERIHMIICDNPCWETCWNGGTAMQEALRHESIETIVVQHPWMENDTYYADIILPTNTMFEIEDIGTDNENGQWCVVYHEERAIDPLYESKSDHESAAEIAKALGKFGGVYENLYERFMGTMSMTDWIQKGYEECGAPAEEVPFSEFMEKGYYPFPTAEDWKELPAGLIDFHNDPENHPLTTPTGKLEYYSAALAEYFPDDTERGPVPKWVAESPEHKDRLSSERAEQYPFLIVSNHPRWRVHAQHDDITWLREIENCKVVGPDGYRYEPVWINPKDAIKLGVVDGDIVQVFNERGSVLGGVLVTERIIPGVVYQDHGARIDSITTGIGSLDRGGANNLIAPTAVTSKNAPGEVTSGYLVGVEKVDVFALAAEYPKEFNRLYDPESGLIAAARIVEGVQR